MKSSGIEKAERNVLPVLNNLLENREMHLEDGRFLIPALRYDKLLKDHSQHDLDKWGLVRVSEDFRVIALGLPIPKYRGASLDPPLRSRFQARDIITLSFNEMLTNLREACPECNAESLKKIVSFGCAVLTPESPLPDFPIENIVSLGKILENNIHAKEYDLINRLYPVQTLLPKDQSEAVLSLFASLKIEVPKSSARQRISSVNLLESRAEGKQLLNNINIKKNYF